MLDLYSLSQLVIELKSLVVIEGDFIDKLESEDIYLIIFKGTIMFCHLFIF